MVFKKKKKTGQEHVSLRLGQESLFLHEHFRQATVIFSVVRK